MSGSKSKWELRHSVAILRIFIGWHFLYEGVIKIYNPDWSSFGYLATAQGPFKPLFIWISQEPMIDWADSLNWMALMFVGISLLLGVFEKMGALAGIFLLALYYLAHPSFPWLPQVNVEGSYWFVNKNLIELAACLVLYKLPTSETFGLAAVLKKRKKAQIEPS
ncbi:MAG: DoxX family membrane protein [Flavobacteriaceae bacterium]